MTSYKDDIAEFPELADVIPFSADWYRRWRDLRLAKYPDVDQGTRDNLDMFVEQAEKREHSTESPIEGVNPMMDVEGPRCSVMGSVRCPRVSHAEARLPRAGIGWESWAGGQSLVDWPDLARGMPSDVV